MARLAPGRWGQPSLWRKALNAHPQTARICALGLLVLLVPFVVVPFQLTFLATTGVYALLTLSVCAIVSYAGQFGLMQSVFATLAGYVMGIAVADAHWSFLLAVAAALLATIGLAAAFASFIFRLSGFYLAIGTLLLNLLVPLVAADQFATWTGGYYGLTLPTASLGPFSMADVATRYFVVWGAVLLVVVFFANLESSRIVRAARAVKANQAAAQLSAIDPRWVKIQMFMLSSVVAGIAGILGTASIQYIDTNVFDINLMIFIFAAVIIGGRSNLWGALLGAGFITATNVLLIAQLERAPLIYGLILIFVLLALPEGLAGLPNVLRLRFGKATSDTRLVRVVASEHRISGAPRLDRSQPQAAVLVVRDLTVRFGGVIAVSSVALEVPKGSIVALMGPNGAGKTTLVNAVTGYSQISSGTVTFEGENITHRTRYQIRRAGISRTLQMPYTFAEMTVWENIALGGDFVVSHGLLQTGIGSPAARRSETRFRVAAVELARRVGLQDMANRRANQLSFGQRRLVDIARALAGTASLLLLDEPFAGLSVEMIEVVKG